MFPAHPAAARDPLVAAFFLQKALVAYMQAGVADKAAEIRAKIPRYSKDIEKSLKKITVSVPLPVPQLAEEFIASLGGKAARAILEAIAHADKLFIPSRARIERFVRKLGEQHRLTSLLPRLEIEDGLLRGTYRSGEETVEREVKQQFNLEATASSFLLHEILQRLLGSRISLEDVVSFLDESGYLDGASRALLVEAIRKHLQGDYIGSIHIFVPRVEQMLRSVLTNCGVGHVRYDARREGIEQKLLVGLIEDARPFLGEDLGEYLQVKLGPDGQNLRNRVCHGWAEPSEFKPEVSSMLLYLVLRLSAVPCPGNGTH